MLFLGPGLNHELPLGIERLYKKRNSNIHNNSRRLFSYVCAHAKLNMVPEILKLFSYYMFREKV